MSTIHEQLLGAFRANRIAWMLFAAFLYVVYGNYQLRGQLDVVCAMGVSYDLYGARPLTDPDQAKMICGERRGG